MKYRTFRNIAGMVGFLAIGGSCYGCYAYWHKSMADERNRTEAERATLVAQQREQDARRAQLMASHPAGTSTSTADETPTPPGPNDLRPVDEALMRFIGERPVTGEKFKDAIPGPIKVNVYSDDGKTWNRAKMDLDRDDKWDESWSFKFGPSGNLLSVERKVSTHDDETYDQHLVATEAGWQDPGAVVATATTMTGTTAKAGNTSLREVDTVMMSLLGSLKPTSKIKDATRGKPYKINLYSDDGTAWNRAKVDLDRDDKWDESWTIRSPNDVERKVAPNDDEQYTERFQLTPAGWQ